MCVLVMLAGWVRPVAGQLVGLERADPVRVEESGLSTPQSAVADSSADRLLVVGAGEVGWLVPAGGTASRSLWRSAAAENPPLTSDSALWRAWRVRPTIVGETAGRWPESAALFARIDEVGPTGEGVWLAVGEWAAVRVGDRFWLRQAGQPVARFEVRTVTPDVCYAQCVPLADGWGPHRDEWVERWPAPPLSRQFPPATAVAFVEQGQGDPMAWVAAPGPLWSAGELRFDFVRDGRYVGFGMFERGDARFWQIRTWPAACVGPPQVGDLALARSEDSLNAGRACGRVFNIDGRTALITAGELDHLTRDSLLSVTRAGVPVGKVRVARVQSTYSEVQRVSEGDGPLHLLDEVRVRPEPGTERLSVARIESVNGQAWLADPLEPLERDAGAIARLLLQPLAIQRDGVTIAVGMTVTSEQGRSAGFVLPSSSTRPIQPGDTLVLESRAAP